MEFDLTCRAKFKFVRELFLQFNKHQYYCITLYTANTFVCLVTNITAGRKSRRVGRREEVTCHPETRDHRCDMRSGRCHGDHRSSRRCQILLGQCQRTRHGIFLFFVSQRWFVECRYHPLSHSLAPFSSVCRSLCPYQYFLLFSLPLLIGSQCNFKLHMIFN